MASSAERKAVVAARSDPVMSAVSAFGRSSTAAMVAAPCFSAYGEVVVAKKTASTSERSRPARQAKAASTPMVSESSSPAETARSPGKDGVSQARPIVLRSRRKVGRYAPHAAMPAKLILLGS
jgi:hypothetical protein